jgi:hypothetical protein
VSRAEPQRRKAACADLLAKRDISRALTPIGVVCFRRWSHENHGSPDASVAKKHQ